MYIVSSEVEKGWEAQKRANISHDMSQTPQIDNSIVEWFRWGGRAKKNQTYCKFVNWCLFYLLHFHSHFKIGTLFKLKMLTMDYENWRYIDSVNQLLSQKILFKKPQNEICRSVKPSVEGWVSFEGFMWDNNWFWAQALCAVNWKYEKEKKTKRFDIMDKKRYVYYNKLQYGLRCQSIYK